MENNRELLLKSNSEELKMLLDKISKEYIPSEDEFINELFYSGLQKAKEFCNNLIFISEK
ncbi:hypothetical protein DWX11_13925 [Ruminococcus sp. AF18-29]|nr:hypothetical protein DWX11_13925 [Ruminococcus sp. AF18-29]